MKKVCNRCKVEKDISEFYNQKYGKFGVRGICKICCREQDKIDRENNREKYLERERNYNKNNRKKRSLGRKNRINSDPLFKLRCYTSSLIGTAFRRKDYKKGHKSRKILGCSIEEFKKHIESLWEPWMNWSNYGGVGVQTKNTNWDIDHIIPVSKANSVEEIIKLNHYTNFRPLCSYYNRYIKREKYEQN